MILNFDFYYQSQIVNKKYYSTSTFSIIIFVIKYIKHIREKDFAI